MTKENVPKFSDYMTLNTPSRFKGCFEPDLNFFRSVKDTSEKTYYEPFGYENEDWFDDYLNDINLRFNLIATQTAREFGITCNHCVKWNTDIYYVPNAPMREVLNYAMYWFMTNYNYGKDIDDCETANLYNPKHFDDITDICIWLQTDKTTPEWSIGQFVCSECLNAMKLDFSGLDNYRKENSSEQEKTSK